MIVLGIDEVGRGCWAGPLVAGAVVLTEPVAGLTDSKLLSSAKRQALATQIAKHASIGLGWVSSKEVDRMGLTQAVRTAMQRAVTKLAALSYDMIIIDGNYNFLSDLPKTETRIKADLTVSAVSAASIVAKVARDEYMRRLDEQYPQYGFASHVGYGTARHCQAITDYGPCPEHRMSYKPLREITRVDN